jgi:hypothetical protein
MVVVLRPAVSRVNNAAVATIMNRDIYARINEQSTILPGLAIRRVEESAPFRPQDRD